MRVFACLLAIAFMLGVHPAHAWNADGHQAVGAIADQLLADTPTAPHVRKILGSTLQTASVWADCAKGVTRHSDGSFSYTVNSNFKECAIYEKSGGKQLMIDFVRRNWDNCHPEPGSDPCHKQYHYTDVATSHDHYENTFVGTSDHDIVAAMQAAIAVLHDEAPASEINIKNKREALRLLAHYLGDVHQPLHVVAVYLDHNGSVVDPDAGTFDPDSATRGGNDLLDHSRALHSEWDAIPAEVRADHLNKAILDEARAVEPSEAAIEDWPALWASDTISVGSAAFVGLAMSPEDAHHHWSVTLPSDYAAKRDGLQREQVIKGGARLAQLLIALFP